MKPLARLILAALFLAPAAHAAEPDLTIEAEVSPPESFEIDDQMSGITGEMIARALERARVTATIAPVPWGRAYDDALAGPTTCAYPTSLTHERQPLFKWVTPLGRNEWALVATTESGIKLDNLEDARKYLIGVYQDDARESYFRDAGGFRVETTNSNEQNLTRLEAGRIDLWAASVYTVSYEQKRGVANLRVALMFRTVDLALACNKAVPDAVIERLNQAVKSLIDDGSAGRIEAKFR